ncbi:MAG: methyltransferase domain-containing protein [Betaproteobacteria bacterium]|nr:methyltransferase domain-containing protein [Betaproteobacteria bacterium]
MSNRTSLDRRALRRAFGRLGAEYAAHAQVQSEIGRRMDARLDLVRVQPQVILDAGAGPGELAGRLASRFPEARVLAVDCAWELLDTLPRPGIWSRWMGRGRRVAVQPLCADFECLPLADASVELVVSNLALNWTDDMGRALRELHRILTPGGLLMFTCLGPDTLREWGRLKAAMLERLPDMHDVGDLLGQVGFGAPVMDQEHLVLTYSSVTPFLRDLRGWGAVDLTQARARGMRGAALLRARDVGEVTLEVVYGHAWKPAPRMKPAEGTAVIKFERRPRPA